PGAARRTMTRPAHRPPSPVQTGPTPAPAPPALAEETAPPPAARRAWGWRVALFLWGSSFRFLFVYAVLSAALKVRVGWSRGGPPKERSCEASLPADSAVISARPPLGPPAPRGGERRARRAAPPSPPRLARASARRRRRPTPWPPGAGRR